MKLLKVLVLAFAGLAVASSVDAQEDWSGWYSGFSAGLIHSEYADEIGANINYGGVSIGLFGGARMALSSAVVGIEASAETSFTGAGDDASFNLFDPDVTMPGRLSLRAIIGLPTGRFLPYLAIGPSIGLQHYEPIPGMDDFAGHLGAELAVGLDAQVSDRAFVRGELRYSRFSNDTYNIGFGEYKARIGDTVDAKIGVGLMLP